MLYLVRDAADQIREHVAGGLCIDNPKVLKRVNDAVRRLIKTDDYLFTLDQVRIITTNNTITLPPAYSAVRLVTMNRRPVPIDSQAFEFIATGPGKCTWDQLPKLIDEGTGHPTYFDMPASGSWHLIAYSTQSNAGTISWRGQASDGADILTAGSPVNALPIMHWATEGTASGFPNQMSAVPVRKLRGIALPTGRTAYVTLYAYDPTTHQMCFLSRYSPSETTPGYRRYRLPVTDSTDGVVVECLAKKQYLPATSLDEVLLIQDIDAVKNMAMSIEREDMMDVNGAVAFAQLSQRQLQQTQSNETRGIRFNVVCVGPGSSDRVNMI